MSAKSGLLRYLSEQIQAFNSSSKTTNAWSVLFERLKNLATLISGDSTYEIGSAPSNRAKNRYRDVLPYDDQRVILTGSSDGDYINASFIAIPEENCRRYILTQGPMQQTASQFWLMVWENRSPAIIMLNSIFEKGVMKCFPYFPSRDGSTSLSFSDEDLSVRLIEQVNIKLFTIRKLEVTRFQSNETHYVTHMHYTHWPDFGVPSSPEGMLDFLRAVRATGSLSDPTHPPVIHCSAGVGRSGAFVFIDLALHMVEEHNSLGNLDLNKLFVDLRRCRMGIIQTPEQLRFCHEAVALGIDQLLCTPKEKIPLIEFQSQAAVELDHVDKNSDDDSWESFDGSDSAVEELVDLENDLEINASCDETSKLQDSCRLLDISRESKLRRRRDESGRPCEQTVPDEVKSEMNVENPFVESPVETQDSRNNSVTFSALLGRSNNALPSNGMTESDATTSPALDHSRDADTNDSCSFVSATEKLTTTGDDDSLASEYLAATQDLIRRREIRRERQARIRQRIEQARIRMREADLERRRWLPQPVSRMLRRFYVESGLVQSEYGAIASTTIVVFAVAAVCGIAYSYWRT